MRIPSTRTPGYHVSSPYIIIQNFHVTFGGGARQGGGGYNVGMPAKRSNPKTMHRAGELRKELTLAEKKLWAYLRGDKLHGVNFRRQHAIGNYIPDFVSIKKKLIIELDGLPSVATSRSS